ncbi:MAG: hypothetical protein J0H06_14415, partial [Actinobacteria bacterium]|nr:hypothetical protein [Actinomycetota bacterium]
MTDQPSIEQVLGRNDGRDGDDDDSPTQSKPSQATVLVNLAIDAGAELFHSPDGVAYATLPIENRSENWPLRTKSVKRWLSRLYFASTEKAPGSQAVADALGVLEGQALFDGDEHQVFTRVAGHAGAIYLDLADGDWRAVRITATGHSVVSDPPVKFVRSRGMLPLPVPESGGSLDQLREFVNYGSEEDFRLIVSWLAMTLRPTGPYPVLALYGEQGSGKSTMAEMLRSLVDPNQALLRPPPRDERDLMIAGNNSRIIGLENLSTIQQWLSDALCRISTGSGFSARELYSDADETIFSVQLPIVLNGIIDVVTKGDLQDRSVVLTLPRISGYVSEDDLWKRFESARPRLLGALLDVVSGAMAAEEEVHIEEPPRMADFARWMVAAAPTMGWDPEELLDAYTNNRAAANETTLEASPLVGPLRRLGNFEGAAADLLDQLGDIAGDGIARSKTWPKSPSALS